MSAMPKTTLLAGLLIFLSLIFTTSAALGSAEWIEHDLAGLGTGTFSQACGWDVVVVSPGTADAVLFFNASTSSWHRHALDAPLTLRSVLAEGHVALAVGTDRAVAYNSLTSNSHELEYNGTLLSDSGDTKSFACSQFLALVVTDQEFCVFDAEEDEWRRLPYVLPGSLGYTVRHQCHDTYAVSFMPLTNNIYVNLVYSLDQHAFNQTDQGLGYLAIPMDRGYAGMRSVYQEDDYLLGYSSATNSFDILDFPDGLSWSLSSINPSESIGMKTAWAGSYEEDFDNDITHFHLYGYDTRHGSWQHDLHIVNGTEISVTSNWWEGGTFCASTYWRHDAGQDDLTIWEGTSNRFYVQESGLAHPIGTISGGHVVMAEDDDRALGVAVENPGQDLLEVDLLTYGRHFSGLDYVSFLSEGPDDRVTINCYNGNARTWRQHVTGALSHEGVGTPHVHVRVSGAPQAEAVFYSAYRNELYAYSVASWSFASAMVTDDYCGAYNPQAGDGVIYDARRGTVYDWSGVDYLLRGDRILTLIDNDAAEARAYCTPTGSWSTLSLPAEYMSLNSRDLVSLIRHTSLHRYYACYAGDGSWAYLEPEGYFRSLNVGDRTAACVTSTRAYALGTGSVSATPLTHLELRPGYGAVEITWAGEEDLDPAVLQLRAEGPDEGNTWLVPLKREGNGRYHALDKALQLGRGGTFTYTLSRLEEGKNRVLDQGQVVLSPLPVAALENLQPNPFNPRLMIDFSLREAGQVTLKVHDLAGRLVRVVVDEALPAGRHQRVWSGRDAGGQAMASGVYLISLEAQGKMQTRKALLVR